MSLHAWASVAVFVGSSASPSATYYPIDLPTFPDLGSALDAAVRARAISDGYTGSTLRLSYALAGDPSAPSAPLGTDTYANVANGVFYAGSVTADGNFTTANGVFAGRITAGIANVAGNVTAGNLSVAGSAVIGGGVTASTVSASSATIQGALSVGSLSSSGNLVAPNVATTNLSATANTTTGNLTATANVTSGNIATGNLVASSNIVAASVSSTYAAIANLVTTGNLAVVSNATAGNLTVASNVAAGNVAVTNSLTAGSLAVTGATTLAAVTSSGAIATTGALSAASFTTAGTIAATGNITSQAAITATGAVVASMFVGNGTTQWANVANGVYYAGAATLGGNLTANYILGDGSQLTNVAAITGIAAPNASTLSVTFSNGASTSVSIPVLAPAMPELSATYFSYVGPDGANLQSGYSVSNGAFSYVLPLDGVRALDLTADGRVANVYAGTTANGLPSLAVSKFDRAPLVANAQLQGTDLIVQLSDGSFANSAGVWQPTATGIGYPGDVTVGGTLTYSNTITMTSEQLVVTQTGTSSIASFLNASASVVEITADGNVGIGNASPLDTLSVAGNVSAALFKGNGALLTDVPPWSSNVDGIAYVGNVFVGNVSVSGNYASSNHIFSGGNVGIGVAAPKSLLDVNGEIRTRGIRDVAKAVPFGTPVYYWEGFNAFTVADEPLKRMTLVGAATFDATYYSTKWNNLNMIGFATTSIQTATTVPLVVPTAYVRLQIPVDTTQHCMFFMQVVADDRWSSAEVWVCNAALTPTVRLQGRSNVNSTNTNNATNSFLGPLNTPGKIRGWYEWIGFSVPLSVIQAHYALDGTSTPVLNLAVARSINGGTPLFVSGLAMVPNPRGVSFVGATELNWKVNTGDAVTWNSIWNQEAMVQINASSAFNIFVPIVATDSDIYLVIIGHNDSNYMGGSNIWQDISGTYYPFNQYHVGLAADVIRGRNLYRCPYGRIVPAATIAALKTTISGRDYMAVTLRNLDSRQPVYLRGIIVENV